MSTPTSTWLVTFADLAALLLAFFVLSFAMTDLDRARLQQLTASFAGRTASAAMEVARRTQTGRADPERTMADAAYAVTVLTRRFAELEPACRPRVRNIAGALLLRLPRLFLTPQRCRTARRRVALAWHRLLADAGEVRLYLAHRSGTPEAALEGLIATAQRFQQWFGRRPSVFLAADAGSRSGDPLLWLEGS